MIGGLCYRRGSELVYLGFGGMFEIFDTNVYKNIGVSGGVQLKTKSYHHFYLGSDIRYFHYFRNPNWINFSPTLFQTIVFVGYEF